MFVVCFLQCLSVACTIQPVSIWTHTHPFFTHLAYSFLYKPLLMFSSLLHSSLWPSLFSCCGRSCILSSSRASLVYFTLALHYTCLSIPAIVASIHSVCSTHPTFILTYLNLTLHPIHCTALELFSNAHHTTSTFLLRLFYSLLLFLIAFSACIFHAWLASFFLPNPLNGTLFFFLVFLPLHTPFYVLFWLAAYISFLYLFITSSLPSTSTAFCVHSSWSV